MCPVVLKGQNLFHLPLKGEVRLLVRSLPRVLPGELALCDSPAGIHHLHHGGSFLAPFGSHAVPLHSYRHRVVDPQKGGRLLSPQHHEPQGDQQDLKVG